MFHLRPSCIFPACVLCVLLCACASNTPPVESSSEGSAESATSQPVPSAYPQWDCAAIYQAGDIVIYKNQYFRVLWWTQGDPPVADVERDQWEYLGDVPMQKGSYFLDVHDDAWYAEAVNALAGSHIMTGNGKSSNFFPSRPITRAQFAASLCRAKGIQPTDEGDNFSDAGDSWYTPYLAAIKQNGIATGYEGDTFHPDSYITRQEMSFMIYHACDGFSEDPLTAFAPYTDASEVAHWAIQSFSWCIEREILQGSGNRLHPNDTASRAEAAQIIYNVMQHSL